MRTLCDVCESAAAIFFCAADEAALCRSCDDKVHMCNKLANRHIRVGLAAPSAVPKCDICENAPAFFYCEIDGSSLCLQCDMVVHVGGKRTHRRYLLLRQRAEFPGDKPGVGDDMGSNQANRGEVRREQNESANVTMRENEQNNFAFVTGYGNGNGNVAELDSQMIDLNARPQRMNEVCTSNQGMDIAGAHGDSTSVVPTRSFRSEAQK